MVPLQSLEWRLGRLSDSDELGTPLSLSKCSQAFMTPGLSHEVPGISALGLPSVMRMGCFH